MKKIIIILATFCFLINSKANTWNDSGVYDISWYSDLLVSFNIKNAKELAGLAYLCNNGVSFYNKTISLQADIDISDNEWIPISLFEGTFNGNYHKIINLNIDCYTDWMMTKGFIIRNLGIIENLELQGSVLLSSGGYDPISAGGLCVENEGKIHDCIVDCEVSAYNKQSGVDYGYNHSAGGICVVNKGRIVNSVNKGNISAKPSVYDCAARMNCAGGITGQNEGEIVNCFNQGDIYVEVGYSSNWKASYGVPYGYAGGICGYNTGYINNAISIANVEAKVIRLAKLEGYNAYGGGIVGYNSGSVIGTYYSSSKIMEAPHIINDGIRLGETQLNNTAYAFTDLLNQNVATLSNKNICFWANSKSKDNNIPFLLNGFAIKTQIENIGQNTANFKAVPMDILSSEIINKGFEYKATKDSIYRKIYAVNEFSANVVDIEPLTTYDVRAFVTTNNATIYFDEVEFTTSPISVKTEEAVDITPISATLNGYVQSGLTAIKSQGFLWKEENAEDFHIVYTTGEDFEYKLENLMPNTMYNYRAFILTVNGDNLYGETMNFSTQSIAIAFNEVSIDHNQIDIRGKINIKINTDVIIEYKKITDSNYLKIYVKSDSEGGFEAHLLALSPDVNYCCRAYIKYNDAYIYSPIYTYKTLNVQVWTFAPVLNTVVTFRGKVIGALENGIVGFEYRNADYPDLIASEFIYSNFTDTLFIAQSDDFLNGNEYKYRAFYQNEEGNRTYGEWVYFVPQNIISDVKDITKDNMILNIYDERGNEISKIKKGVNIIRYSNGLVEKMLVW